MLRRLTGKCLCALVKLKASDFFEPLQFGVACPLGSEKIIHGIRSNTGEMRTLLFSRLIFKMHLTLCLEMLFFMTVLYTFQAWAIWCYSSHPILWHPLSSLTSELGVQQGDPLGPLFFALVLHRIVQSIDADNDCLNIMVFR